MTSEEMDQPLRESRDNQVVQGVRLHRIETSLERLEALIEQNTLAIGKLADAAALLQTAMKRSAA